MAFFSFLLAVGILMCLVEKLGALSITAVEIKLLVSLLQIETCYAQVGELGVTSPLYYNYNCRIQMKN